MEATRRWASRLRQELARPGRRDHHAAPWTSHVALRAEALRRLDASPRVVTDFVVRDRYRAGLRDPAARRDLSEPSTVEFHDNVLRTDYTVCVRGGGNFSVRLYEALCLGRVPVLVDTDCILPWRGALDWDELAVVVDAADLDELPDRLADRHGALGDGELATWHRRCRRTWEQWLSLEGFFGRFARHFPG
jgi:hypothetical protein